MRRLVALVCGALLLATTGPAQASWTTTTLGSGTVGVTAVGRASAPAVVPAAGRLELGWATVTTVSGAPVTGYEVLRQVGKTTTTVCKVTAAVRTCADTSPVAGPASYGVVARLAGWRGPEGPSTSVTYDTTPPTTAVAVSPAPNAAGWSRSAVTLTLTAEDDRAGVDHIRYAVDGGPQVVVARSSTTVLVTGPGEHTVTYSAVDRMGNAEAAVTVPVRIDPTAPLSTLTTDASLNAAGWSTRPVTVGLEATDTSGSGVRSLTRQVGSNAPVTTADATVTVRLTAEGRNTVTYAATDNADNTEGTKSYTVKVDTVAPSTTATPDPAPNAGGWHATSPVVLTLAPVDATSGVSSLRWRTGTAAAWTSVASWPLQVPVSVDGGSSGTATIQYQATDAAGNLEAVQTHTVKIDRSAPAAPTGLGLSADTGASATDAVTSTAVQSLRGTAEAGAQLEVRVDGDLAGTGAVDATGAFTVPMGSLSDGTRTVTATALDAAGNRSTAAILTVRVDQTAPTAVVTFPGPVGYPSSTFRAGCGTTVVHDVCGTAADPATPFTSGVTTVELELRRGTTCLTSTGTFSTAGCATRLTPTGTTSWSYTTLLLSAGSYTLTVWVTDLAGSSSQVSVPFTRS